MAPPAFAHAVLLRADPQDACLLPDGRQLPASVPACRTGVVLSQAPRVVRLVFSEAVQPVGRGLRILGPDGRRADRGSVRVEGPELRVAVDAAAGGTYQVRWTVISQDAHPERGTMAFSVARVSAVPSAESPAAAYAGLGLGAAARALHFAGYALGFGAFTAWWLASGAAAHAVPAPDAWLWRGMGMGVAILLVAEPLALAAESLALGAVSGRTVDPEVVGAVLDSRFGLLLSQRLGAAILLWVVAGALRGGALRAVWAVPLLGAALAVADGQAAHAAGVRPAWIGLAVNGLHVSAMGIWAGTLALTAVSAGLPRAPLEPVRVHRLAVLAALALAATGIVMAAEHLAALRDLATTAYGRVLAVKVAAVAVTAALGWLGTRGAAGMRRSKWEAVSMGAVLVLAGLLVWIRPPVP